MAEWRYRTVTDTWTDRVFSPTTLPAQLSPFALGTLIVTITGFLVGLGPPPQENSLTESARALRFTERWAARRPAILALLGIGSFVATITALLSVLDGDAAYGHLLGGVALPALLGSYWYWRRFYRSRAYWG